MSEARLSPAVARLRSFLEEADIPSGVLRRDPRRARPGCRPSCARWSRLKRACHDELHRFVDREIELFGSVRQRSDALFTDRSCGPPRRCRSPAPASTAAIAA
jgi:hypothetical protein